MDFQKLIGANRTTPLKSVEDCNAVFNRLEKYAEVISQLDEHSTIEIGCLAVKIYVDKLNEGYLFDEIIRRIEISLPTNRIGSIERTSLGFYLYETIMYSKAYSTQKELAISLYLDLKEVGVFDEVEQLKIERVITPNERRKL